jgi:surface protein
MVSMFQNATAFDQNLGSWDVANVTNFLQFLRGKSAATFSAANLDAIYNGWSASGVQPNCIINFGTAQYTVAGGQAGKNILLAAPNNWTIADGGGI